MKVCSNAKTPELAGSNLREGTKRSGLIGEFLSWLFGDRNCGCKDEGSDCGRSGFTGTGIGAGIGTGIGAGIGAVIGAEIGAGEDGAPGVIKEI